MPILLFAVLWKIPITIWLCCFYFEGESSPYCALEIYMISNHFEIYLKRTKKVNSLNYVFIPTFEQPHWIPVKSQKLIKLNIQLLTQMVLIRNASK